MNAAEETRAILSTGELNLAGPADRRADVDIKQVYIAGLLKELGVDGLLVVQPENFSWLTSGGSARSALDAESLPGLYFTNEGRWLLSCNADTQRLFDEEIDGLGFQLKEWPWQQGRSQLLNDLCQGRKLASDAPLGDCPQVGERLALARLTLSEYERACYRALGQLISHTLEATSRTFRQGDSEREVAGQIGHRLIHRGAMPVSIAVSADGRSRNYRQGSFTATPIRNSCVLKLTARKYGLCATASRSVCFGTPDALFRKEHDAASKVCATYVASSWPDAVPRQILTGGQRIYQLVGAEGEWYLSPQGHVTGRACVEMPLTPKNEQLLQANWAITWQASIGAAVSCDTFLIGEEGARAVTGAESWPLKRIRTQGAEFVRPDLLVR
ncbi:MAG: M24 family metallopeptidase [Planctomycetota bacterium]